MLGWVAAALVAVAAGWRLSRWRSWARVIAAELPGATPDSTAPDEILRGVRGLCDRLDERESELGRLAGVVEGMVEGMLVIDGEGNVVLANRRADELLDLPSGETHTGRSLAELNRDPDLLDLVRTVRQEEEWEGGQPIVQEVSVGKGGETVLRVTASRLSAREDMERWFVLVFHDISAIRQLEQMRRDFVANVSHELRTPLAAIGGYTETLLDGALDDPATARRFLETIERHSNRLGRLVDDLLTLSDLELGRTEIRASAQDGSRIVDACFETLQAKAEIAGVALENPVGTSVPRVQADPDRLEQALLNLIDNAIKYTPSGGSVRVTARLVRRSEAPEEIASSEGQPAFVEFVVADTGVGVPAPDLARLTERFYRVDKARSRELGGTGLGLAIVKHIVQAHGGSMSIESELQKGTAVRLRFPAAP